MTKNMVHPSAWKEIEEERGIGVKDLFLPGVIDKEVAHEFSTEQRAAARVQAKVIISNIERYHKVIKLFPRIDP